MPKYIFLTSDGFGFKESIPELASDGDREISEELYKQFFNRQNAGESLRVKNIDGVGFNEIFESYKPESPVATKTLEEEIAELKQLVADLTALQLGV